MLKTIIKVLISSISVLLFSCLGLTLLMLNPSWSYANETQHDFITIHHNQVLETATLDVLDDAIEILKTSDLYNEDIRLDLCLNDGSYYPNLHPIVGQASAYAMFNKTILDDSEPDFSLNVAVMEWAINNFERRTFNLTYLLAHEFTHNLQYAANKQYYLTTTIGKINWKLEGHAEYISRQFQNDDLLKEKIKIYLEELEKTHNGFPVFPLEDGTVQILSYYKYALVTQYLMEQKNFDFDKICKDTRNLEDVYNEMLNWFLK